MLHAADNVRVPLLFVMERSSAPPAGNGTRSLSIVALLRPLRFLRPRARRKIGQRCRGVEWTVGVEGRIGRVESVQASTYCRERERAAIYL